MIDNTHYVLMAEYNQWMNNKLYAVCAGIPDRDRKRDLGAFFKSIHGTLNHLLYGDKAWMGRFTGQTIDGLTMGLDLYEDFHELRRAREEMDKHILKWAMELTSDWLARPFQFTSKVDNRTRTLPTWALVSHMFNHQTHHRGQLTTLIRQLGRDPGVTDIPWLPRFEDEAGN